jgi:hypothetical protein
VGSFGVRCSSASGCAHQEKALRHSVTAVPEDHEDANS